MGANAHVVTRWAPCRTRQRGLEGNPSCSIKAVRQLEADVQETYFSSMTLSGRELLITSEAGKRYAVDIESQKVRTVD